jgi:glycosyltransferase involved in cell wall biosynthesis
MICSLVIPVYRNEASIPELIGAIDGMRGRIPGQFEAVFVVDGSPDRSAHLLGAALPTCPFESQLVLLSRNFGSFAAIAAGLQAGRGDFFAVMAADLQEPPQLIVEFFERLVGGDADLVVGAREHRDDPWSSRVASSMFWRVFRLVGQSEMPSGGVDVFGCTRRFRDHLLSLQERNSTLVGLLFWLGFRRIEIPYRRRSRRHGRSAWSFARKTRYLLDSIFAFSDLPLRILWIAGCLGVGLSLLLGTAVIIAKASGLTPPGYAATVLVVMFFGGLNSAGIGLLGEYLWRTFENTKNRPLFVVASSTAWGPARQVEGAAPKESTLV